MWNLFLPPWLTSMAISFITTPVVIKFAGKLGIIDDPKKSSHPKTIHVTPTPRGGGIPIFIALLIATLIFLPIDKHIIGILVGALILVVMGVLDDKYNLNPYLRLVLGVVAASAPIAAGIGIAFITNPFGGVIDLSQPQITFSIFGITHHIWLIADLFAIFWVTFLMNMINMGAKGVDGQLSGVTVIAAFVIALISLKYSADITQWPIIILAAITGGAYLGFLPWHIFPQKIMPGYGGSTLAGYLLGVLSILATAKVGVLLVVLGIPLIDTGYVIVNRILKGKSPVWGDRNHLHHKLLDAGLTKGQVAIFYWTVTAFLGIIALNLNTSQKIYTMVGVAVVLGGFILWLTQRSKNQKPV
ncbi:MAG TPA: MraY family glycosyltransferase [Patescibacteria group bacterium]|nr:MraY family glycosyltransferase [Patescibacteria group bacterium]